MTTQTMPSSILSRRARLLGHLLAVPLGVGLLAATQGLGQFTEPDPRWPSLPPVVEEPPDDDRVPCDGGEVESGGENYPYGAYNCPPGFNCLPLLVPGEDGGLIVESGCSQEGLPGPTGPDEKDCDGGVYEGVTAEGEPFVVPVPDFACPEDTTCRVISMPMPGGGSFPEPKCVTEGTPEARIKSGVLKTHFPW